MRVLLIHLPLANHSKAAHAAARRPVAGPHPNGQYRP